MCGIAGILRFDGAPPDPGGIRAMNDALVHRGPDSEGMVVRGPAGLGARRLAIIDLATGDQPVTNEDGSVWAVQNGEIYNYRELRNDLLAGGHAFRGQGDTEVLAHCYEAHGPAFVERLRGMFAVAVWDDPRRRLVLARDRFGIKPLYVHQDARRLVFASEVKALLTLPDVNPEIDLDALEAYLALNAIPAPRSIFAGIRKLPAGHRLTVELGGSSPVVRTEAYADVRPVRAEDVRREPSEVLAEELRERLRASVRSHLIADVPVGVLLSGGLDSAALTAFAAEATPGRVRTFSIGFEERSFDELHLARQVAERFDTDHHELVVRPDAAALAPALARTFDEPFADSSALPTWLVSEMARGHVTVALSGEGGDELFGGYYTYVADLLAPRVGPLVRAARPLIERLPTSTEKVSFDYKAKRFARAVHLPPLERHFAWKEIFSAEARAALLAPDRRGREDPLDAYRERYAGSAGAQPLARLQDVDLGIYLPDDLLVKTDRASMAHSLETRVPFLDVGVAELALALPDHEKVRGFATKRLLRQALRPILPADIVDGKKQGFSIPLAAWLRTDLHGWAREILAPGELRRQGYLQPAAVTRLLDEHAAGRADHSRQLWNLLAFTLWFDAHGSAARQTAA